MGKAEGSAENWHGHVTALTVAPEYRRLGLAAKLMHSLEDISEKYVTDIDQIQLAAPLSSPTFRPYIHAK